jgi:TPR repeat protein
VLNAVNKWIGMVVLLGAIAGCATSLSEKDLAVLSEGQAAYENHDYQTAFSKLSPLADKGAAMAQNTLGRMYMQGQGVPRDFDKALLSFRQAAKQQLPNAQNNLGVMYAGGYGVQQDFKQAVSWFEKAANQNYALAMNNLADLYENGMGVAKDPLLAKKWRTKSLALEPSKNIDPVNIKLAGSDDYEKAQSLYYGFKYKEALPLYLSAAKQGNPEAQLKLASMYKYAQGVEKSEQQSKFWADKAAAQGYSDKDGRDRVYLIDSSSEEAKRSFPPMPEPRAISISAPSPASVCNCSPGIPNEQCCPDKQSGARSMAIKPQ